MGPRNPHDHRRHTGDEASECFSIAPTKTYLVENRTPFDIEIEHDGQTLLIPALATRKMSGKRLVVFQDALTRARQVHQLRVTPHLATPPHLTMAAWAFHGVLLAAPLFVVVRFVQDGTLLRRLTGLILAGAAVLGLLALLAWALAERGHWRRRARVAGHDGDSAAESSGLLEHEVGMRGRITNSAVLLVVFGVGALLPATWIYFGTELNEVASFEDGLNISTPHAPEVVWRSIQIVYVAVLVTLPAMLYFLFDRVHIRGVVHQWAKDIFRLDRRVDTIAELEGRYGHKLTEATRRSPSSGGLSGSKRSPIIVATVLFAVGWTLLILPTRPRDATAELDTDVAAAAAEVAQEAADEASEAADAANDPAAASSRDELQAAEEAAAREAIDAARIAADAAAEATDGALAATPNAESGATLDEDAAQDAAALAASAVEGAQAVEEASGDGTFQIFDPEPSAATAAFLGAYFFSLFTALRSFSRRDLRPKLYATMAARVAFTASAAFLIVVVTPYGSSPPAIALAFLAGVTPLPIIGAVVLAPFRALPTSSSSEGSSASGSERSDGGSRLAALRAYFGRVTGKVSTSLANRRPFQLIDQVDLFDGARLESEGVSDVESLAHCDIVDLMIATRLPAGRLVDWIDQALLVIHLGGPDGGRVGERLSGVRALGIRSATDLVDAASSRGDGRRDKLMAALGTEDRMRLDVLVGVIRAESNYLFVRWWSESRLDDPRTPRVVIDARGQVRRRAGLQERAFAVMDGDMEVQSPEVPDRRQDAATGRAPVARRSTALAERRHAVERTRARNPRARPAGRVTVALTLIRE